MSWKSSFTGSFAPSEQLWLLQGLSLKPYTISMCSSVCFLQAEVPDLAFLPPEGF